jgi:hypothetical protein
MQFLDKDGKATWSVPEGFTSAHGDGSEDTVVDTNAQMAPVEPEPSKRP